MSDNTGPSSASPTFSTAAVAATAAVADRPPRHIRDAQRFNEFAAHFMDHPTEVI